MALQNIALDDLVVFSKSGAGTASITYGDIDGLVKTAGPSTKRFSYAFVGTDSIAGFVIPALNASFSFTVASPNGGAYAVGHGGAIYDSLEATTQKVTFRVTAVAGSLVTATAIEIVGTGTISTGVIVHTQPEGLSIDGAVTQIAFNTNLQGTGWSNNNGITATYTGANPAGELNNARVFTDNNAAALAISVHPATALAITGENTNYVFSVWVKHGVYQTEAGGLNTGEIGYIRINSQFGGVAYAQTAIFDAESGRIRQGNSTAGFVGVGVKKYPNGWSRFWLVCKTDTASTTVQASYVSAFASSRTLTTQQLYDSNPAQQTSAFGQHYFYGAMLQKGVNLLMPTDYIPNTATVAGLVSSQSERMQINGANFIRVFPNASAGGFIVDAIPKGSNGNLLSVANPLGSQFHRVSRTVENLLVAQANNGTSLTSVTDNSGYTAGERKKIGYSWDAAGFDMASNGVLVGSGAVPSGGMPSGLDHMDIGGLIESSGNYNILSVSAYNDKIESSTLAALTSI